MKSMTETIRIIGQKEHRNIDELVDDVYNVCKEHGITTKNNRVITRDIVETNVKRALSKIRHGDKAWSDYGLIIGADRIKIFDNDVIAFKKLKHYIVSEYINDLQIRLEVYPALKGLSEAPFTKPFTKYKDAKQYYTDNKDVIGATRLLVGNRLLEVDLFN